MAGVLNPKQAKFVSTLSQLTGLDPHVVSAWTLAEESGSAAQTRASSGNMNWLNYSAGTGPGGRFDHPEWKTPEQAATAIAKELKTSSFYKGIAASAGKSPEEQLKAIYSSPWDVGGYNKGKGLTGVYNSVAGKKLKLPSGTVAQTQPPTSSQQTPAAPSGPFTPNTTQGTSPGGLSVGGLLEAAKAHLGNAKRDAGQSFIEQAHAEHKDTLLPNLDPLTSMPLPGGGAFAPAPVNKLKMTPAATANAKMSPSGKAIVAAAVAFKGTPYSWGGGGLSGPTTGIAQGAKTKGFDCSSLLQYSVYQATGKKIPRVAQAQYAAATPVSIVAAKPGDAIFFGTTKNVHHVGIYIGNGQFIEAPHTGAVVRVSTLADRKDIVGAGRF
jgi:cell wall-associated NlpC family hydrolase